MAYSSIIRKKCRCGCGKMPTMGFAGYNQNCRPDLMEAKIKRQNSKQQLAFNELGKKDKRDRKRQVKTQVRGLIDREEQKVVSAGRAELVKWFNERRKEMKGVCSNCGGKSCKDNDTMFISSIAHILPKAYFPSIATHEKNWLELCFYGESCHTNMDNKMLDLTEMACWDEIVTKFVAMYPSIDKKERRRIPEILLQYIEVET